MHNLSCENEFYLHENEKSFPYQRLSTYLRFETEARENSEMAYWKRLKNWDGPESGDIFSDDYIDRIPLLATYDKNKNDFLNKLNDFSGSLFIYLKI